MKHAEPILKDGTDIGANSVEHARHLVQQNEYEKQVTIRETEEMSQLLMEMELIQREKEDAEREGKEKERQIEAVAER